MSEAILGLTIGGMILPFLWKLTSLVNQLVNNDLHDLKQAIDKIDRRLSEFILTHLENHPVR